MVLKFEGCRLGEGAWLRPSSPAQLAFCMMLSSARETYRTRDTHLLTGIGWVGSWAVEEGWGATQIGHGGRAVAIHARGDRVIVGLLRGGARHIPMWWHAAWVAGETWETKAKPRVRVASIQAVAFVGDLGYQGGTSPLHPPHSNQKGKDPVIHVQGLVVLSLWLKWEASKDTFLRRS